MPGQTFGDVLDGIFTNWAKLVGFAFAILALVLGGALAVFLISMALHQTGLRPTEVVISGSPRVVYSRITKDSADYLVVVQPLGWQSSTIRIMPGDVVEIRAEGRVSLSLQQLVDLAAFRHELERRIDADLRSGRIPVRDSSLLPERHYTIQQRDSLRSRLTRGWTGPSGYPGRGGILDSRYEKRTSNKILPEVPFGALVATVHNGTQSPARFDKFSGAFVVGDSLVRQWTGNGGTLWFNVNDILDDQDEAFPDKFYIDNSGVFLVRVRVRHS